MRGEQIGVLPLGRGLAVLRADSPAVVLVLKHLTPSEVYHGLYGEHHAGHKEHAALAAHAIVVNIGRLVELQPHAVAAQLAHHGASVGVGMLSDYLGHIAHKGVRLGSRCAQVTTLLCHPHQPFPLRVGVLDDIHPRSVGVVAFVVGRHIHIDNIAGQEHLLLVRNTMTHHIIDACAYALGETVVVERSRRSAVVEGILVYQAIDVLCSHTGLYLAGHEVEGAIGYLAALADTLYLLRRLDEFAIGHKISFRLPIEDYLVHLGQGLPLGHNPIGLYLAWHIGLLSQSDTVADLGCVVGRVPIYII